MRSTTLRRVQFRCRSIHCTAGNTADYTVGIYYPSCRDQAASSDRHRCFGYGCLQCYHCHFIYSSCAARSTRHSVEHSSPALGPTIDCGVSVKTPTFSCILTRSIMRVPGNLHQAYTLRHVLPAHPTTATKADMQKHRLRW